MMKNSFALCTLAVLGLIGFSTAVAAEPAKPHSADTHTSANIVETAKSAGQFNTLLKAATAAGLAGTLSDDGPFTVFAPTDEAFAKLPAGALDNLLQDKAQLKKVLLYHVAKGKVTAKQVTKMEAVPTLAGSSVAVEVNGDKVMIGTAKVVKADVMASNGVIHVIDTVLMPPSH